MSLIADKTTQHTRQRNISYYDEIAPGYDDALNKTDSNRLVRDRVREKLWGLLESGWVLDFGGGTGLDLPWLTAKYRVLFCEPAAAMREKAIRYNDNTLRSNNIVFLDGGKTDFSTWETALPFLQKADAILSNFGPVNCIPDIGLLFSRLAMVIKPGGHCILVLLDLPFKKRLHWHRRNALVSLITGRPFVMYLREGPEQQTVYMHTRKAIKKAAFPYFDYCSDESLGGFGFTLIHLVRK